MGRNLTPQEEAAWDRSWQRGRSHRRSAASLWSHVQQLAHAIRRLWDSELWFLVSVVILVAVVVAIGVGIIDHIHRVDRVFGP